jgi:hypothetical protein
MKKYILIIALMISATSSSFSQMKQDLSYFVNTNFNTPTELKDYCGWIYLLVRLKLDDQNKILSYECLNKFQNEYVPNVHLETSFDFLKGYQLKDVTGHPKYVLFYFSIENYQDCTVKPSDITPNRNGVIQTYLQYVRSEKSKNPGIYIYDDPVIIYPFSKQR